MTISQSRKSTTGWAAFNLKFQTREAFMKVVLKDIMCILALIRSA